VISTLQHSLIVAALLASHLLTAWFAVRRVRELQNALNVRDILVGANRKATAHIAPGGTMVLSLSERYERIHIWSRDHAHLQERFDEA
jgi:hypothetical protein